MMLKIEIRTTGREIFLLFSPPFSIFRAMKYAVFNFIQRFLRKYTICSCVLFFSIFISSCSVKTHSTDDSSSENIENDSVSIEVKEKRVEIVSPGAYAMRKYLPSLRNKRVGIVANPGSLVKGTHIVDTLLERSIDIQKIYSPEHGFRGKADAGEIIEHGVDKKTGIEIISLYGKNRKPSVEQLAGIDVMVFYLQDVGVRFYTYISTLTYVMEACAENNIPLIVLDCPNPNGDYIDGPILQPKNRSFIGLHPVPVVYGMTIGEYALMVNGEKWISTECELTVIPCVNYTHESSYHLPVNPSPNLRSDKAIAWYPSLCFFEGTVASVGRGTPTPFEVVGHPLYPNHDFMFTPLPDEGSKNPLLNGQVCYGMDFRNEMPERKLVIKPLLDFYQAFPDTVNFFLNNGFFELLAGTDSLRQQIMRCDDEETIRASWKDGLDTFKAMRENYLLYP